MCGTRIGPRARRRECLGDARLELKHRSHKHLTMNATTVRRAVAWRLRFRVPTSRSCWGAWPQVGHTSRVPNGARRRNEVMNLITRLRKLLRNDSGQDLLEYALLVALIALVAVGAITTTGTNASDIFDASATSSSRRNAPSVVTRVRRVRGAGLAQFASACAQRRREAGDAAHRGADRHASTSSRRVRRLGAIGLGTGPARVRTARLADRHRGDRRRGHAGQHHQHGRSGMSLPLQNSDALVLAIVAVGMGAAAVIDLRTRRIPNLLTASLAAAGIGIAAAGLRPRRPRAPRCSDACSAWRSCCRATSSAPPAPAT